MKLKQLITYENSHSLEATWTDTVTTQELVPVYSEENPEEITHWEMGVVEKEVEVKCRAYSADQMDELREDLGPEEAAKWEDLISQCASEYIPPTPPSIAEIAEKIKAERDRRKFIGVKVGDNWFHSDPDSRTQQIGLVLTGDNMPDTFMWKTLTKTGNVSVKMTPAIARQILFNTATSDDAIFTACSIHIDNMSKSPNPSEYDYMTGWPPSFEDE